MPTRRVIKQADLVAKPEGKEPRAETAQPPRIADDYLSALIKIVPSEIIAAFLAIDGVVRGSHAIGATTYWAIFAVLIVLCFFWILHQVSDRTGAPPILQIGLSVGAFIVWVHAIGGPFAYAEVSWYNPALAGIIVILYTLLVPLLAKA